jgi:DNA-binding response OmpR family regulator
MSVLIADDDRVTTMVIARQLKAAGYESAIASDAMQALMIAMRTTPEAILLDINMPGGSGLHVLERLKASSKTFNIPVIVISANTDPAMPGKVRDLGADEFLAKPVNYDTLVALLARLTGKAPPATPPNTNPPSA